jgi:hypothetical protein
MSTELMVMNNLLERVEEESVVVEFKIYSGIYLKRLRKSKKTLSQGSRLRPRFETGHPTTS